MSEAKFTPLTLKNLTTYAHAAIGTTMFQHIYVRNDETGQEIDTMEGGFLSCASFLSTILTMMGLIDRPHSTVSTTLAKLYEAGWEKTDTPRPGAIVHWGAGPLGHEHIGFYFGNDDVVSNMGEQKVVGKHGLEHPSTPGLMPDYYLWNPKLAEN